jgi:serine/threonine-protein kinase RsbW
VKIARKAKAKPRSRRSKLSLELKVMLAANPHVIDPVVQSVMKTVRGLRCFNGKDDAVELALSEALANAVVHGAKSDHTKIVECDVLCDPAQGIVLVVRDPGTGFLVDRVPTPLKGENIFSTHGRGIYLINQLMDEVQFLKNGSEIRMVKK